MPEAIPAGLRERTAPRLVVFLAALALMLAAGFGVGRLVGDPTGTGSGAADGGAPGAARDSAARDSAARDGAAHTGSTGTAPHDDSGAGHHAGGAVVTDPPGANGTGTGNGTGNGVAGLALSDSGFRLAAESTAFTAGRAGVLRFQIVDSQRRPVTRFAVLHEKALHLIVARRDLSGFQHLHPSMAPDGTWSTPLTLPEGGAWRAYADFTGTDVDGRTAAVVLGVDLTVPGDYRPRALPASAPRATSAGFEIRYEGTPRVGSVQPLLFRIARGGARVPVERYLGAYGHLVILREGDLGYLHVHPESALAGDAIKFWVTVPSPGRYRMFLDFQVAGAVHTVEFTLPVD